MDTRAMACCGVREIYGISGVPEGDDSLKTSLRYAFGYNVPAEAAVIFTAAAPEGLTRQCRYGTRLVRYIRKYKLGTVTSSPWAKSSKTNNLIKVYVWNLDKKNIRKWLGRN